MPIGTHRCIVCGLDPLWVVKPARVVHPVLCARCKEPYKRGRQDGWREAMERIEIRHAEGLDIGGLLEQEAPDLNRRVS